MDQPWADVLAFAEDPFVFLLTGSDEERILTDRYCLTVSPGHHYWSTSVQRIRFGDDDVESGVAEIHARMAAHGRDEAAWKVGPSSTPSDLFDRLVAMGMQAESEEGSVILMLDERPRLRAHPFDVRMVSTFEEHLAAIEIAIAAFEFPLEDAEDERGRARDTYEIERAGGHSARLLVLDGDRPVATGTASFSPFGAYLGGGATLPADRRRGAMGAMIASAWDEAVRRGSPTLVTWGGSMAAPALVGLGFRDVGRMRHLVDRILRRAGS